MIDGKLGESLSALMDGEAADADIERVLDSVRDPALRDSWRRYHNARGSLEHGSQVLDVDLSARIMAAIEDEPAHETLPPAAVSMADAGAAATASLNDQRGESLSALMDGEAGEADIERVLDNMHDPAFRDSWRRYHSARGSLESDNQVLDVDLSGRIMAAIEEQPTQETLSPVTASKAGAGAASALNEQLGESLSALMDGEAAAADIERVLDSVGDPGLREAWRRYHGTRAGLEPVDAVLDVDLSGRIMAAIEAEPGYDMLHTPAADQPEPGAAATIQPVGSFQRFMKPIASFAVAASVTAAVLLGSQYYGLLETGAPAAPVADSVADRGSPVTLLGGTATRAGYGYAIPAQREAEPEPAATATDYDAIARERLRRYMLPHADEAALNSPQGMMPYAKVATFQTEE